VKQGELPLCSSSNAVVFSDKDTVLRQWCGEGRLALLPHEVTRLTTAKELKHERTLCNEQQRHEFPKRKMAQSNDVAGTTTP